MPGYSSQFADTNSEADNWRSSGAAISQDYAPPNRFMDQRPSMINRTRSVDLDGNCVAIFIPEG